MEEQPSARARLAYKRSMVMDVAPREFWMVVSGVLTTLLAVSILFGALGPDVFEQSGDYAHNCPLGLVNRTCSPSCPGCISEFTSNTSFVRFLDGLEELNQFFALDLVFVSKDEVPRTFSSFDLDVRLLMEAKGGVYVPMRGNLEHAFRLECDGGNPECEPMLVVLEPYIESGSYQVDMSMPDSLPATQWITNIHFVFTTVSSEFTVLSITTRVVYAVATVALAIMYLYVKGGIHALPTLWSGLKISSHSPVLTNLAPGSDADSPYLWSSEQRSSFLLLLAFIVYTNPFMPFELTIHSWFTSALSATTTVAFEAAVLLVVLITFGRFTQSALLVSAGPSRVESQPHGAWFYGPKISMVLLLSLLMWISVVLVNIELQRDPVRAWDGDHKYAIFVFVVQAIWVITLAYALIIVIIAGIKVRASMPFYSRYLVFSTVTAIYLFCISFAALTGNLRPTSSFAFLFFFSLRASFVYALAAATWPVDESGALALTFTPSSATYVPTASPLLGSAAAGPPRRTYDGSSPAPARPAVPVAYPAPAPAPAPAVAIDNDGYAHPDIDHLDVESDEDGLVNVPLTDAVTTTTATTAPTTTTPSAFPSTAFSAEALARSSAPDNDES